MSTLGGGETEWGIYFINKGKDIRISVISYVNVYFDYICITFLKKILGPFDPQCTVQGCAIYFFFFPLKTSFIIWGSTLLP